MVFPSLPIYLDPPNWSQQQPDQQAGNGTLNPQIPPPPHQPPSTVAAVGGGGGGFQGSITRPGSMTDRARLAKIPQPDAALKCPRCESTNTKFCYYNNYSLSQPRHFCKTCRRYWTRGGALRNVPVGGGCRRNKRTKASSSRSKSPTKADHHRHAAGSISTSANSSSSGCTTDVIGHHLPTPAPSQMPFLPTLHHYSDYVSGGIGLNFGTIPQPVVARNGNTAGSDAEFQIVSGSLSGGNNGGSLLSNGLTEQWRLPNLQQVPQQQHQQFPFLTNLEPPIGLFHQFNGENGEPPSYVREGGRFRSKAMDSSVVSGMPQFNTTKMEENHQGLSLPKKLLGSSGNDLFWAGSGNAWNENPSFTSSTSHLL